MYYILETSLVKTKKVLANENYVNPLDPFA